MVGLGISPINRSRCPTLQEFRFTFNWVWDPQNRNPNFQVLVGEVLAELKGVVWVGKKGAIFGCHYACFYAVFFFTRKTWSLRKEDMAIFKQIRTDIGSSYDIKTCMW